MTTFDPHDPVALRQAGFTCHRMTFSEPGTPDAGELTPNGRATAWSASAVALS